MKAWEELVIGVVASHPGWTRVLSQLGIPFREGDPSSAPIIALDGWPDGEVLRALEEGAVVLAAGVEDEGLLGPGVLSVVTRFHASEDGEPVSAPTLAWLYEGPGWGVVRRHEDRLVKGTHEPGVHALIHERRVGSGTLIATGVPLTKLLGAVGDRLRPITVDHPVTERVASVDTAGVEELLRAMVKRGVEAAGLPMVHLAAFPEGAPSVLIVRVDVDGDAQGRLAEIIRVADGCDLPLSIFLNGALTQDDPIPEIGPRHEVGQHGWEHNVFDTVEENRHNLRAGAAWVEKVTGRTVRSFVGPRGLWNVSLDRAMSDLGYRYGSEFGLAVDGLPFRTPAGVLQIPVHPYSPERAVTHAIETHTPPPSDESIRVHYLSTLRRHIARGRPVHVYGHPTRLGDAAATVLPDLAAGSRRRGVPALTLGAFAAWWERRARAGLRVHVQRRSGEVDVRFAGERLPLHGDVRVAARIRSTASAVSVAAAATAPEG